MKKEKYGNNFKLGVLGGGQLGRMMIQEAINMDIHVHVLDPSSDAPCSKMATSFTQGDFNDYQTVIDFGKDKDLITIEIEHVNTKALYELESLGVTIYPQPAVLEIIQDKGKQKIFYADHQIPTASFKLIEQPENFTPSKFPLVQKARTGGYDGKGVKVIQNENAWKNEKFPVPSVIEDAIEIEKELSVIVARNPSGEIKAFPVVELVFDPKANLVDYLLCPAEIDEEIKNKANEVALNVIQKMNMTGLLAVELFLTKSGEILVNEVAPRTHNSGHQSIEGNATSQFAQHLRAILDFPLGDTSVLKTSVMLNVLGDPGYKGNVIYSGLEEVLKIPQVYPHLYGKTTTKPYRKMGHITVLGENKSECMDKISKIRSQFKVIAS